MKNKKKWDTSEKIGVIVLCLMVLFNFRGCIKLGVIRCVETQCASAEVYAVKKLELSKRGHVLVYTYHFFYNNRKYEGFTPDEYAVGDTLMVVFWPKFPQINFSQKQIEYECK